MKVVIKRGEGELCTLLMSINCAIKVVEHNSSLVDYVLYEFKGLTKDELKDISRQINEYLGAT